MMKKMLVLLVAFAAGGAVAAAPQDFGLQGWGIRAGVSVDPDQGWGGIHWEIGSPTSNLRFRPNLELGLGDDVLLLAANGEAAWFFRQQAEWIPYAGGAVSVLYFDVDLPPPAQGDDSDVEFGFYGVGGIETQLQADRKFLIEARIGAGDYPDFKLGVGWTF